MRPKFRIPCDIKCVNRGINTDAFSHNDFGLVMRLSVGERHVEKKEEPR